MDSVMDFLKNDAIKFNVIELILGFCGLIILCKEASASDKTIGSNVGVKTKLV